MKNNLPKILTQEPINDRHVDFQEALFSLDKAMINGDNFQILIKIYSSSKQLNIRNKILRLLYDFEFPALKGFFVEAFKKERYLDMKIYALRGLSNFMEEQEISKLLIKFKQTLVKRQETTPYNYQEYELLRGKNALPYLYEKFGYECFQETLAQVNAQYNAMPDAFKGHFTTDENGEFVALRKPAEVNAMMDKFWKEDRSRVGQ